MNDNVSEDALHQDRDVSTSYRLSYVFEPVRYNLYLAPDLQSGSFKGTVSIEGQITYSTDIVELHAADLVIISASTDRPSGAITVNHDPDAQVVKLKFPEAIEPGDIVLTLEFSGELTDRLRGFYLSTYKDSNGEDQIIATTQFEATDARMAFPCIDEPDRKATFAINLEIEDDLEAVSNWPVASVERRDAGKKVVTFGETCKMSTYLVAWAVGRLVASPPRMVGGIPVRVVHVPGKEGLSEYALDVAEHAIRFFTSYFGIDYPGEKLDLIGVPDFAFGAMENLGCITFRESLLLLDPEQASRPELERAADVIAHEIAHMWFGDLVTMKWWNGIWLNEAFATFMELLCVDAFRPEWHRWVGFGIEREQAMDVDALHSTRPVEYPVGPPEEAQSMFDVITYQKGASVLRMLEQYLGGEVFAKGVGKYLREHAYSNTETADLWDALGSVSGERVTNMMESWIFQSGFPMVSLVDIDDREVMLSAMRFFYGSPSDVAQSSDDASISGTSRNGSSTLVHPGTAQAVQLTGTSDSSDTLTVMLESVDYSTRDGDRIGSGVGWLVPVRARRLVHGRSDTTTTTTTTTTSTSSDIWLLNAGGSGFYRVHYPSDYLQAIAGSISSLDQLERFNLVGDAWACLMNGKYELDVVLALFEALAVSGELDPDVWLIVIKALSFMSSAFSNGSSEKEMLGRYASRLLRPVLGMIGMEAAGAEGERIPVLRSQLISTLGSICADEGVIRYCRDEYAKMVKHHSPLPADVASAVLRTVARFGGKAEFDEILDRYRSPSTPQEENRFLYALGGFHVAELSDRAFELALHEVRSQNAPFLIRELLANESCGETVWNHVTEHWDGLLERIPENTISRMVEGAKLLCRDAVLVDEVRTFLATHPVESARRAFEQVSEKLAINFAFAERLRAGGSGALEKRIGRLGTR
ncbi:MAG: M1 family metallopeptidase [Actinobacteria bacterium]|nr:M1 family metallopeptidase [Actinomycetota bacterium]MCL5445959.1 M1 family metallopeptidase [Actinomycetota bacterium]